MSSSDPPNGPLLRMDVETTDGAARLRMAGELDLSTVPVLQARVAALRAGGSTRIVLDLAELDFIDSTGLRMVLEPMARPRGTASPSHWCREARRCSGYSTSPERRRSCPSSPD